MISRGQGKSRGSELLPRGCVHRSGQKGVNRDSIHHHLDIFGGITGLANREKGYLIIPRIDIHQGLAETSPILNEGPLNPIRSIRGKPGTAVLGQSAFRCESPLGTAGTVCVIVCQRPLKTAVLQRQRAVLLGEKTQLLQAVGSRLPVDIRVGRVHREASNGRVDGIKLQITGMPRLFSATNTGSRQLLIEAVGDARSDLQTAYHHRRLIRGKIPRKRDRVGEGPPHDGEGGPIVIDRNPPLNPRLTVDRQNILRQPLRRVVYPVGPVVALTNIGCAKGHILPTGLAK